MMARVLHLDDSALDAELIRERLLAEGGPGWDVLHVPTREAYEAALAAGAYDLVLADYNIPGYDGLSAVRLAHRVAPDAPIIVISGSLSEEEAVGALRAGATDYIFKQRLQRLAPAARRALDEANERRLRREAEARVRELSERFSQLAQASSDVFWMHSLTPRRTEFVSPSVERIWGVPPSAFLADPGLWARMLHPEDRERVGCAFEAWVEGRSPRFEEEYRVIRPDGGVRWVQDTGTILRDASGAVPHLSGVARDVTDRKAADRRIAESERRFRATFEQAAVGIAFLDFEGRRMRMNQRYCEILGYSTGELLADAPFAHPEDAAAAEQRRQEIASGAVAANRALTRYIRKDSSVVWCDVTNSLVRDAEERPAYILTVIQDATERVQAQRKLAETEALLRSAITSMAEGFILQDRQARIVAMNPSAERMLGVTLAEAAGKSSTDPRFAAVREDGRPYPPEDRPALVALRTGEPQTEAVMGFLRPSGERLWVSVNATPLRVPGQPAPQGVVLTFHDITEARRAQEEIRRLNTGLERKVEERTREVLQLNAALERRAAEAEAANRELESFSYSVSHDLRAPLHAVAGFAQALHEDHGERLDAQGRHYLDRIRAGAERMESLIADLLSLARLSRAEVVAAEVDVSVLAADAMADVREREPRRRALVRIRPGMRARADKRLLRVALTNLLANAWKFTARREEAVIEVGQLDGEGSLRTFYVRDNGAGFDPSNAARLFGAFQRLHTQSEFPGTGIGLATVRRVVERHGGEVRAEGAVDAGATFYFSLPAPEAP